MKAAIAAYLKHVNEAFPDTADPGDDYNWEDLEAREAVYRIALDQFRDATKMVEKGQPHDE